jgi:gliding motility-associated-like protein
VVDNCNVYVPSAFTPNNNGKNDLFRPVFYGIKKLHRFSVFARSGELIYTSQTIGEGWDGKYKGQELPSSVFVWYLEYDSPEQKNLVIKGTVTLMR